MKQHSPAAERNKQAILQVLERVLPDTGLVLEVASGSGQHASWFAERLPSLQWLPSDADADRLTSILAWTETHDASRVLPPMLLDVTDPGWADAVRRQHRQVDAIVSINMIHIAPWHAAEGLMTGAARLLLAPHGVMVLYGPFKRDGRHTAESNEAFDVSLRTRNPAWGVRDLADVEALAQEQGLLLRQVVPMPANNLSLVFTAT